MSSSKKTQYRSSTCQDSPSESDTSGMQDDTLVSERLDDAFARLKDKLNSPIINIMTMICIIKLFFFIFGF